jgi:hypothetical protein
MRRVLTWRGEQKERGAGCRNSGMIGVCSCAIEGHRRCWRPWVRRGEGSSNEGEGGKTYLFCTVLKEVEGARVSDDTRTVGRRRMYY